jgi:hypothetical protein
VLVLRLNFRATRGDSPTLMQAVCVRFCADGTLRGPDNYVVARCLEGGWQVGGRMHRELECEGPVMLRLSMGHHEAPRRLGPFQVLRTAGGMLYGDDACLNIHLPGRGAHGEGHCQQLTMSFEGEMNAKA